jgi:hypothetical protein
MRTFWKHAIKTDLVRYTMPVYECDGVKAVACTAVQIHAIESYLGPASTYEAKRRWVFGSLQPMFPLNLHVIDENQCWVWLQDEEGIVVCLPCVSLRQRLYGESFK